MEEIKIEYLDINDLVPNPRNPRRNDCAVDIVAKSIKEFKWKTPIVLGKDNKILSGHTRYKAAKKLGITKVPIVRANDLSEVQQKAYAIMDNKSAQYADWEMDMLKLEMQELDKLEFNTELTGFSHNEIGNILDTKESEDTEKVDKLGALIVTCPKCKHKFERKDNLLNE